MRGSFGGVAVTAAWILQCIFNTLQYLNTQYTVHNKQYLNMGNKHAIPTWIHAKIRVKDGFDREQK